ncbi:MAG: M14 family zinc carboxypeptidase, partial [Longimicrobiales bacterium]|nr:M14 family zinc carboxypeptidase [Longimicrobiales bacterium]
MASELGPLSAVRALLLLGVVLLCVVLPGASPLSGQDVPTPEAHFGFVPGADRQLAGWDELTSYYEGLARSSPRVTLDTLGSTTRGRPLVMLTVTSEENQARLGELRQIQTRLSDPRRISESAELEELLEAGRAVVLVTHGIHSNEVGSVMVAPRLLHRLATSTEPRVTEILENVVVLDIPSLNPDGTEWVADWYHRWLDTEYEASPLPWLYHHYVGHDNNRDWYAFTQIETEHVIRGAHQAWHPHVVHDIHQMGRDGPRIFLPPYAEPWEPNVDPALTGAVNDLGTWTAATLLREGKSGVVVNAIYDAFAPARAYQHYHAGARILSETASARLASPDSVFPWELRSGRGYDPRERSWNHPDPWDGGRWGIPEITDYMESAAMAVLLHAARNRRHWLELAHGINRRAVEGWDVWPAAWMIPSGEESEPGLSHLLRILSLGEVEVHRIGAAVDVRGRTFEAGSWVIPMEQPYAGFAQTLLEAQEYPDLRQYPDGPPVRPYDATAHTLPLLMGVEAHSVDSLPSLELGPPIPTPERQFDLPEELAGSGAPRVALYKSNQEPMEAGWTRWLFDRHGLAYDTLGTAAIREGGLAEGYDVLVLQSESYGALVNGWSVGEVPPEWAGGLGVEGSRSIRDFVRNGGRLVAVEQATDFVVR